MRLARIREKDDDEEERKWAILISVGNLALEKEGIKKKAVVSRFYWNGEDDWERDEKRVKVLMRTKKGIFIF